MAIVKHWFYVPQPFLCWLRCVLGVSMLLKDISIAKSTSRGIQQIVNKTTIVFPETRWIFKNYLWALVFPLDNWTASLFLSLFYKISCDISMVHCHPVERGFLFWVLALLKHLPAALFGSLLATGFGLLIMRLTVELHCANVCCKQPYINQLK